MQLPPPEGASEKSLKKSVDLAIGLLVAILNIVEFILILRIEKKKRKTFEVCLVSLIFRYFPVREIYIQTSGFHHLHHYHQPKVENPGTTRVFCSVYIFCTIYIHNMPERQNYYLHFFSGWVVCVIFIFRSFQIVSF